MGRKGALLAVALGLVAVVMALVIQEPVPEGTIRPYQVKLILFAARIRQRYVARIIEVLGLASKLEAYRHMCHELPLPVAEGVQIKDTEFDDVPVRLYFPPEIHSPGGADVTHPGVLLIHGGGWALCDLDSHIHVSSKVSRDVGAVVAAVHYRRSPEFHFDDIMEDVLKAWSFFTTHSAEFGVDPHRIAVLGESAGGHLSAALTLRLRDLAFQPQPKVQVLVYPVLQAYDLNFPSYQQNSEGPFILRSDVAWVLSMLLVGNSSMETKIVNNAHVPRDVKQHLAETYLNHNLVPSKFRYAPYRPLKDVTLESEDEVLWEEIKDTMLNPYFNPLLAENLSELPPTIIYVGQYDVLRDESLLYAQRLRDSHVAVELNVDKVGWHAIWNSYHVIPDGELAADWINRKVKEQL